MEWQVILTSIAGIVSAICGFVLKQHVAKVEELEKRMMRLELDHSRVDEKLKAILEDVREIRAAVTHR